MVNCCDHRPPRRVGLPSVAHTVSSGLNLPSRGHGAAQVRWVSLQSNDSFYAGSPG
jgi:hypothetical protein